MSETAKTVEPKKEAPSAEQAPAVKPVVEKLKAKPSKIAPALKKPESNDCYLGGDDECMVEENVRQAFFRDSGREYPLKDLNIEPLRQKLHRSFRPYFHGNKGNEISYPQSFKHIIVRDTLYIVDNRSGITLSEQMWLDGSNPFSYLNEDLTNLPTDIVVLENSTILAGYLSLKGESALRNSSLKATYNVSLSDSRVCNGNARMVGSISITDTSMQSFSFSGDNLQLKDLNITEYYINVKGAIRISEIRWSGSNELRIFGDSIKDVEIGRNGTIHNTGSRCRFDYHGEKSISICSMRRVDNGFFMGSTPIPFIRCDDGLLVGGTVFTYADFKLFIETTMDKLAPPKQIDNNYQSFRPLPPISFGFQGGFASTVQNNLPGEILNKLYQLISRPNDNIPYRVGNRDEEKYTEVDSLLTLTNEQIAMLAGQISSRLRLFKELDAII